MSLENNKSTFQFKFEIEYQSSEYLARVGKLYTVHGIVHTPVYMPVGTAGSVKTLSPDELKQIYTEIILANTYHLMLRPGIEVLQYFRGLHRFMSWDLPILTDSGGFQIFSLKQLSKVSDDGVLFSSHLDGSKHWLTPEEAIRIQQIIGSDIMMVLDVCSPYPCDKTSAKEALHRTANWAKRCRNFHPKGTNNQALFGIVQGSTYHDLRLESLQRTLEIDFDGLAIGGLSVGEPKEIMYDIISLLTPHIPQQMPRYIMGVGEPIDLLECVELGIDMFDCVLATRIARHGAVFTTYGRIDITALPFRLSDEPIEENCNCYTCKNFSKGYIRHLFKAKEMLAMRLASIHNIFFLNNLMSKIREAIKCGNFKAFKETFKTKYLSSK